MATVKSIPLVLFFFILLAVLAATQSDNIMKSTSWKEGGIGKVNEKKVIMKNNEGGNSINEGDEKVYIDFCKEEKCVYKDLDLEVSCYCCMNVLLYAKKQCWVTLEECHSKCRPYGRPPKIFPTP